MDVSDDQCPARKRRRVGEENQVRTRASADFNWALCIFCQKHRRNGDRRTHFLQQEETIAKVRAAALKRHDDNVLHMVLDSRCSIDGKYHNYCMIEYLKSNVTQKTPGRPKISEDPADEFFMKTEEVFENGKILSLAELEEIYNFSGAGDSCNDMSRYRIRAKLVEKFGSRIRIIPKRGRGNTALIVNSETTFNDFVDTVHGIQSEPFNNDGMTEMSPSSDSNLNMTRHLYYAATRISNDLKSTYGMSDINAISSAEAKRIVPASLYQFLCFLLCGEDKPSEDQIRTY